MFEELFSPLYVMLLSEIITVSIIVYYWGWRLPRQPYALILRKHQNTLFIVKKKILSMATENFSVAKNTYFVDWVKSAYISQKGKPVLLYHEGNPQPIPLEASPIPKYDSGKLDLLIQKSVLKQILQSAQPQTMWLPLMISIVIFLCGLFLGIIVSPYLLHIKV